MATFKRPRTEGVLSKVPPAEDETVGASGDGSDDDGEGDGFPGSMIVQFTNTQGEASGPQIDIPTGSTPAQLEEVLNALMQTEERTPYSFFVNEQEVMNTLRKSLEEQGVSTEKVLSLEYQPLAVFRVRPVTRCTDTMPGHTEAILHLSYSPDGASLASGGGDFTVRFWDVNLSLPKFTCTGHRDHVLCTAWSPDGLRFASADKKGVIIIWDPLTGQQIGRSIVAHKQHITALSWEPLHSNAGCERLASSSKDSLVKIWNVRTGSCLVSLSGHADSVECIQWGGEGLLYSGSRDRTIKVWSLHGEGNKFGILVRTLTGHGHRVNSLALSTDAALRTGAFDHTGKKAFGSAEEASEAAKERYQEKRAGEPERLVSGSDDFTLFLWSPAEDKKPIARMTGHQQLVNHIAFSPDGRHIASASFDKKVKVWDGRTGKFTTTLTGHVGAVYRVAWASDSRMLVSASKDSTVKLWELKNPKRAVATLPGHADEVYALDWAPNGTAVASGSKDRTIKIWKH